ncbi:c-type cytochrome [Fodinibius sediminis]|uniref:Cytochrome c2 n=1 Tax=Fodinibius sediminis TaxID=1214077 RepID=A0A521C981_9BACT|nr:c-type cytochrome [Fodinibius sediminis]SMO55914.1 Cytochrome c2 [Fodinibius sediminis]
MKATKYLYLAAIALPVVLSSCRGQISEKPPVHPIMDMDQQERFEPQERNAFFADNRAMRQPVEGTVARGNLKKDTVYYQGINTDSSFVADAPVKLTKSFLYRGKDRYEVFCTPCHGLAGDGQGIIMANNYGYVPAPSFHIDRLREVNDGYLYSVIANGIRNMPSYAQQIPVRDRWAIVSYVRALQQSQNATEDNVQQYDVDLSSLQEEYKQQQAVAEKQAASQQDAGGEVSAERGKTVAAENACNACHSTDGAKMVGPTWQNLFGSERTLDDGSTVTADEEYLRESIVNPSAKIAEGFPPSMVPYDHLSDSDINSLIEYIKSLSENAE